MKWSPSSLAFSNIKESGRHVVRVQYCVWLEGEGAYLCLIFFLRRTKPVKILKLTQYPIFPLGPP